MALVKPAEISGRSDSKSRSTATRRTCLRLAASASRGRRSPATIVPPITPRVWNTNCRRVTWLGITYPLLIPRGRRAIDDEQWQVCARHQTPGEVPIPEALPAQPLISAKHYHIASTLGGGLQNGGDTAPRGQDFLITPSYGRMCA